MRFLVGQPRWSKFYQYEEPGRFSKPFDRSFFLSNTDQESLFPLEPWKPVNNKLVAVLSAFAVTVKMDVSACHAMISSFRLFP